MSQSRILVVDDDALNRIKLSTNLEDAGYLVALAENGAEALEKLRGETFDTVLLDLNMPVMDGFETLNHLKADARLQYLPVIVISAEDDLESVVRCIEMGAADHLPKPFNPVVLRARVAACVGQKRSHDREAALFSELQENYQRLQNLEKQRDDLTHMIVHDLRSPLTSLLLGLQMVPHLNTLDPAQSECLKLAERGGQGLLAMINELLDISKMEDGSMQLEMGQVEPQVLLNRALSQVEHLAKSANLSLEQNIGAEVGLLRADEDKLVRVLVNLCSNAIKFTPQGGSVKVAMGNRENEVLFRVADTGEGIPPDQFERVFEKFGQVETRKTGRKMSTGLGLTFCKMAIEKHGGRIWLESELGRGTTFFFTIPEGLE